VKTIILIFLCLLQFDLKANQYFENEIKALLILMDYQKGFSINNNYKKYIYSSPQKINKCLYKIDVYKKYGYLDYEIDICERNIYEL